MDGSSSPSLVPPSASLSRCVRLHPAALFSICDSFIRRGDGAVRVIGSLLGAVLPSGDVDVRSAYAVPHNESSDQVALDIEYHHGMAELSQRVNPKETVVGWYATGDSVSASDVLIQDFFSRSAPNAVHVTVDTAFLSLSAHTAASLAASAASLSSPAIKAYVSSPLSLGSRQLASVFRQVPLELAIADAERIGVASLQQTSVDRLPTESEGLSSALGDLQTLLETAHSYTADVLNGSRPADAAVGRALFSAVACVPRVSGESWERLCNGGKQDILLVLFISNLARAQLSLAEKLNSALQPV